MVVDLIVEFQLIVIEFFELILFRFFNLVVDLQLFVEFIVKLVFKLIKLVLFQLQFIKRQVRDCR